jgi:hypothetical protein
MRWLVFPLIGAGFMLMGSWSAGIEGIAWPGLAAGVSFGLGLLLVLRLVGAGLDRLLQQTRLEDPIVSVKMQSSDWSEQKDVVWLGELAARSLHTESEPLRHFVWQDDLPPVECLAEVEP